MFKQMFDDESSTYTYLIVDDASQEALLIDPVSSHMDAYISLIAQLNCKLKYALETHVHADHITASGMLRDKFVLETGVSAQCGAATADIQLNEGDILLLGQQEIKVIATPGHTAGSISFLWHDRLFTGDSLLINGCGRTDFQGGNAGVLYDSITNKIFTLPDETLVYPAHDYQGRHVSCVAQERSINPRLVNKTRDAFIQMMDALDLPKPKLIDVALSANRMCGVVEENIRQG
ncbi:MAG: MBL fold metallo-hydrolase [Pseudomonadota bacterium]